MAKDIKAVAKEETPFNNTVHFIFQGKGGIGKTFAAVLLAQHFQKKGADLKSFDTDQENTTFAHYKALNVKHIPVMTTSRTIDHKKFDALIEDLINQDGTFVIDNGSNTFSPLLSYMIENDIIPMLTESGKKVFIHTIIGGGDTLVDTANGFNSIANGLGDTPLIVWLNEHFGKLETSEGKAFQDTKVFKNHEGRIKGVVLLPERNRQTYGDDIKKMNSMRLTIDEVIQSPEFSLMEKQRIKTVGKEVFAQLDNIEF